MIGLADTADAEPAVLGPEWSQDCLGLDGAQRPQSARCAALLRLRASQSSGEKATA